MTSSDFFRNLEVLTHGESLPLQQVINQLHFNDQELIPAITQDATNGEVLMLAWMNRESLTQTLSSGLVTYYSRSRQQLWQKGKTSGHYQQLKEMRFDCDGDAILCRVHQTGGACHTGRSNCFYLLVDGESHTVRVNYRTPPT